MVSHRPEPKEDALYNELTEAVTRHIVWPRDETSTGSELQPHTYGRISQSTVRIDFRRRILGRGVRSRSDLRRSELIFLYTDIAPAIAAMSNIRRAR